MKFSAILFLVGLFVCFYSNAGAQTFCADLFQVKITEQDILSSLPTKPSDMWKEPTIPSNIEWSFVNVVPVNGKFEMSSSQGHRVASLFEIGIIKSRKSDYAKLVHVIRLVSTKEVLGIAVRFHDEVIFTPKYVPDEIASSSAQYRYDVRFTLISFFDDYFRDYENLSRYRFKPHAALDLSL